MDGCEWAQWGSITLTHKKTRQKETLYTRKMGHHGIISVHLWPGKFPKIDMCVDGHTGTRGSQVGEDEVGWVLGTC